MPACWRCNCGKGGRSLEQYRDTRARADPDIPNFTEKELRWLALQGITLPPLPVYRFWFEEQGLRTNGQGAGSTREFARGRAQI